MRRLIFVGLLCAGLGGVAVAGPVGNRISAGSDGGVGAGVGAGETSSHGPRGRQVTDEGGGPIKIKKAEQISRDGLQVTKTSLQWIDIHNGVGVGYGGTSIDGPIDQKKNETSGVFIVIPLNTTAPPRSEPAATPPQPAAQPVQNRSGKANRESH